MRLPFPCFGALGESEHISEGLYVMPSLKFGFTLCQKCVREVVEILGLSAEMPRALGTDTVCFLPYNFQSYGDFNMTPTKVRPSNFITAQTTYLKCKRRNPLFASIFSFLCMNKH